MLEERPTCVISDALRAMLAFERRGLLQCALELRKAAAHEDDAVPL
ncbi:MAG TPA: hypothetical protein VH560_02875 [Polyangia bacterium]|nr:hypothetical protein [Polyangia bacterium]